MRLTESLYRHTVHSIHSQNDPLISPWWTNHFGRRCQWDGNVRIHFIRPIKGFTRLVVPWPSMRSDDRWSYDQWSGNQWSYYKWSNDQWSCDEWSGIPVILWPMVQWPVVLWPMVRWPVVLWSMVRWPMVPRPMVWWLGV